MKKKFFTTILLSLIFHFVFCKPDSSEKSKLSIAVDTVGFSEAKAYKMLYENQVKSNDAVLKTIYYALGGLGTAVLLVFASNWWFNDKKVRDIISENDNKIGEIKTDAINELTTIIHRLYSDKMDEINQKQLKFQEQFSSSIMEFTNKFNDFSEKSRIEIKEDNKNLSESFQKQLDALNKSYEHNITTLNELIISQNSSNKQLIENKESLLKELIQSEQKERTADSTDMRRQLSKLEYYMWDVKGVSRNAFAYAIEELSYMLKNKSRHSVVIFELTIERILESLKKCTYIYNSDKIEAIALVNDLPESEKIKKWKSEILKILDEIEIKTLS